jgi:hypothetical protein
VCLVALASTACSSSSSGGGVQGCSPARPHVSTDVLRPGDPVTVSVSAVACRPKFTDGRRVTLTWEDGMGRSTRLGTVTAQRSGAFTQEVTIPRNTVATEGDIAVSGIETPCADTGSCAAYSASLTVVDTKPNFAADDRANHVAADIADRMQPAIEHRASFFEISIVPDGLEVVLHTTRFDRERAAAERAFETARAAVPVADRAIAEGAHLHVLFVQHDRAALERLTTRIAHDGAWQRRNRIELSQWGPDSATDSVRIALVHYGDAAAIRLLQRYGGAISVSTLDAPLGSAA